MLSPYVIHLTRDKALSAIFSKQSTRVSGIGISSAKAYFVTSVVSKHRSPVIWLVSDANLIQEMVAMCHIWSDVPVVGIFEESSESTLAKAVTILGMQNQGIIVTTDHIAQSIKVLSHKELKNQMISLEERDTLAVMDFFQVLIAAGYESVMHGVEREGQYQRRGGIVDVFPIGALNPIRIELFGDKLESIHSFRIEDNKIFAKLEQLELMPAKVTGNTLFTQYFTDCSVIYDEIDREDAISLHKHQIILDTFLGEENQDLGFTSVLRYNSPLGFIHDLKEKMQAKWSVIIFVEEKKNIQKLLKEYDIPLESVTCIERLHKSDSTDALGFDIFPDGFINHHLKLFVVSEKEIFNVERKRARSKKAEVDAAFLANLALGNFVVHFDHGIGKFNGIEKKTVSNVTKEYLYIEYAQNDKLFVPVDQAEKVNKYIGVDGSEPKLTRLGSAEWANMTKKIHTETIELAKELLELYAKREEAKGFQFDIDTEIQKQFEDAFPYQPTDGQIEAINDVKADMENKRPMDRLVCGDVGFGKTEVAMRAAFKAVQNGKQVACLAPITILCNQHFKTFVKRMSGFGVRIAEMSRFRSKAEQKVILEDLRKGKVDIVIGTHSLLQESVEFKDLGLLIIDEEQRFGVKQKETLKERRLNTDILTLTATPIPRTLNMALSGIRDISTITTPPPGRLPIHTEVRRFSMNLIRDVILRELERGGQVYFLHNRVQTIEGIREKLEQLVPEAKFVVAHGKLRPVELEKRIFEFKEGKFDVLISSTIIENGIDLENANTLIVDQAENLGLAQAYQLRGRVGRSKKQAYAYFLYHAQKLRDDAKKRLRAIIEASELGSGFQIAMRDLEIRGAGDILGVRQHGVINAIGVSHFTRLLAKTIDDLRMGKIKITDGEEIITDVKVEISLSAYIPDSFIPRQVQKIRYYQRMSGVDNEEDLRDIEEELQENYGDIPQETQNLIRIIELKLLAQSRGVVGIREIQYDQGDFVELHLSKKVTPKAIIHLLNHCDHWQIVESKLKVERKYMGDDWTQGLKRSLYELKE